MEKLRVGYILDDTDQPGIAHDLIARSKSAKAYTIDLLIIQRTHETGRKGLAQKVLQFGKRRGVVRLIEKIAFGLITRVERLWAATNPQYASVFQSIPLDDIGLKKIFVRPLLSKSGHVFRYSRDDLEAIRRHELDVLVRGGAGILRGEILTLCRFGVISFHHGDNNLYRGGPPGFWEVLNREPSTGFIIQRLLEELDGGDVLFTGSIPTAPAYVLNLVRLYLKSAVFMHEFLERLGQSRTLPEARPKRPYGHPLYRTPSIGTQCLYLVKTASYVIGRILRKLRGKSLRWSVAYQFAEDWKSAVLWRSSIIKNPPNRFLADPFVVYRNGSHVCFVEDYDHSSGKGKITAFKITRSSCDELGVALEEKFHLSYPFLFEHGGELFMCPECHEAKDIRVYRCIDFPLRWQLHKVLMPNVSAADTNIFSLGGKWWMLTNIDSADMCDHSSELHLFYADRFDSSEWKPHPSNPVIFDALRARNGGLILDGAEIYRVFQVQGFGVYGQSMGISKITTLTTESYSEEFFCSVPARFFSRLKGAHTYSFSHGLLAVDCVSAARVRH